MARRTKPKQKKAAELPLVAIDAGSHSIRAIAAERIDCDTLRILGVESIDTEQYIEKGVVMQTTKIGYKIREILRLLANRINIDELPTAFVTMGGRTMMTTSVFSKRNQIRKKEITQQLLDEMQSECKTKIETKNQNIAVLGLIPKYFVLDGEVQEEPPTPDQKAIMIEAHYNVFAGMKDLEYKLQQSFDRAGTSIERAFVRPDALVSAFACEDADILKKGCAVIDMGAQTTTLTIFKGNQYLVNKVIPLGGYHITRNIEQNGFNFSGAERLKKKFGIASPTLIKNDRSIRITSTQMGEMVLKLSELAEVIEMKLEEMIAPIMELIHQYNDDVSVVFITGGASMMQGMVEYIQSKTKIPVMYGSHAGLLDRNTPDELYSPEYASLVGALILGSDHRASHQDEDIKEPGFVERIKQETIDFFTQNQ
jgi:cell division protein FtsA